MEKHGTDFRCVFKYDQGTVLKYPKHNHLDLQFIADTQTYLSHYFPEVLPAKNMWDYLEMPIAPGTICSENRFRRIRNRVIKVVAEVGKLGYHLKDANNKNIIYDSRCGEFYLVDFSKVIRLH